MPSEPETGRTATSEAALEPVAAVEAKGRDTEPAADPGDLGSRALRALARLQEAFHSSLAVTADQVRSYLEAHGPREPQSSRTGAELGLFATGRIDPQRLSELVGQPEALGESQLAHLRRVHDTLSALLDRRDDLFRARAKPGGDLPAAVAAALAEAGRAFGAARVFELARTGRLEAGHESLLESFPFHRWSGKEKQLAPPLVVEVEGADLQVGGLAQFLDGSQKIVLAVRGETPPAPLVRLITPGVLVLQTDDPAALEAMARWDGPAVAAVFAEPAARFVYDAGGPDGLGRLQVSHLPEEVPRRSLGTLSAFQQRGELRMLSLLAARWNTATAPAAAASGDGTAAAAGPSARGAAGDDVDLLAAWLLRQADLTDL